MPLGLLDHFNVRTTDLAATRRFYCELMGLKDGFRPNFSFPGAWLYSGDQAVVHVRGLEPGDPVPGAGTGSVDHIAFVASGLKEMRDRLTAAGFPFREREVPNLGLKQLFVTDPNGVLIELNYPASEPG
jgi:catechol 2,3-dioxygenase-like lactoylglutathione lyase family enzyme